MTNGGLLPTLTLIKNQGKATGERIISEDTSRNVRRLLRLVVEFGTGSKADVLGYRVGGKTGTAEKINSGGSYNPDSKIASFISVFPVDDPKYAVLVMVDEPKGNKATYGYATGGWVSAPVVGRLIHRMGPLLGIMPKYNVAEDDAERFWTEPDSKPKTAMVPAVEKRYVQQTTR
jgi:cell division protein FtsI (penicillin-binding protein 3)